MNTKNSKTNESYKFFHNFMDKLNLKVQIKVLITHGKTLDLHMTTINLKFLPELGMMNLIFLMDHILFQC